jgi:rhodanese-related sulfurtransferase/mannose-6-phosphate isomerase-like protein (cupin superfamily)
MQPATNGRFASDSSNALIPSRAASKGPQDLADIVARFASSDGWLDRVRLCAEHRWYERLYLAAGHDIWVISWMPGQTTGFHDHGESSGAFVVVTGVLEEHRPGHKPLVITAGKSRAFGPEYMHDVRNVSLAPSVSIHAYSPPLTDMNEYELDGSRLVLRERTSEQAEKLAQESGRTSYVRSRKPTMRTDALNIEQTLSAARARLRRLSAEEAYEAAAKTGTILVDIRPDRQRAIEGCIPGALIVERNVLEWRLDPTSSARLPAATDHGLQVIVFCSEGYTSSLAAAALQDLGLWRATDMVGGFHAWNAAGLPVRKGESRCAMNTV